MTTLRLAVDVRVWALFGHGTMSDTCPLSDQKRTSGWQTSTAPTLRHLRYFGQRKAPEWGAWLLMSAATCDLADSRLAPLLVPLLGRAVLARLDQHHLRYPVRLVILRSLRLQRGNDDQRQFYVSIEIYFK